MDGVRMGGRRAAESAEMAGMATEPAGSPKRSLCANPRGMRVAHNAHNGLDVPYWPKRPLCATLKGG